MSLALLDDRAGVGRPGELADVELVAVAIGEAVRAADLRHRTRRVGVGGVGEVHPPPPRRVLALVIEDQRSAAGRGVEAGEQDRTRLGDRLGDGLDTADR